MKTLWDEIIRFKTWRNQKNKIPSQKVSKSYSKIYILVISLGDENVVREANSLITNFQLNTLRYIAK